MRCKDCGWPNRPGETNCVKCGSVLESGQPEGTSLGTAMGTAPLGGEETRATPPPVNVNQTIREEDIFGKAAAQPNICEKCGYPLRPGLNKCPNCNSVVGGGDAHSTVASTVPPTPEYASGANPVRRPTVIGGTPNLQGTVNVWTDGVIGLPPSFMLSPVQRSGERKKPDDREFEGENISLNRDNTDPGNMSITSKTQAMITRRDDKWYLEDMSDQKTTFIRVSTPVELHDGDTILMGNRLFIFHE